MHKPQKLTHGGFGHGGFGLAAFGIALVAGAGLLAAFNWPAPHDADLNRIFLGKAMVACALLETVAFTLAGTALTDTRHNRPVVAIMALLLAGGPLALVMVGLFAN